MYGKKIHTADSLTEAITLRLAGYSIASIVARTGIPQTTLSRHFNAHGVTKGGVTKDMIEKARQELLDSVADEAVREAAAKLIADDLAHTSLLREKMLDGLKHMEASDLRSAALLYRAAAAYSVAIGNTSNLLRKHLRMGKEQVEENSIPELTVTFLTEEEIKSLRDASPSSIDIGEEEGIATGIATEQ